jgi:hypothetical protein
MAVSEAGRRHQTIAAHRRSARELTLEPTLFSDGPPETSNGWVRVPGLGFLRLLDP